MTERIPDHYEKELVPDFKKIVEVVAYIVDRFQKPVSSQTQGTAQKPTQYDILKSIFVSDRNHLNKYGRPITFDNYVAMKYGPVPSFAYDLVKPDFEFEKYFGESKPWFSAPGAKSNANEFTSIRGPRLSVFSETDVEEMDSAIKSIRNEDFEGIKRITHEDKAYQKAWRSRSDAKSKDMELTLLFDDPDPEHAENLRYISCAL